MTLSQELTTLEHVTRLALADLSAIDARNDLSRQLQDDLKAVLSHYKQTISDNKLRALAYGR